MNEKLKTPAALILLIVITIAASYSYSFHGKAYDNALTRLDLAFSLGLDGTLDIDKYHSNTIDKAFYDGHFYTDKAPGVSLVAAPFIPLLSRILPFVDWTPESPVARTILAFLVIGIPSIISALMLFSITRHMAGDDSLIPVLCYALGSLAFPYSVMFYSHQFCAALLLGAFFFYYRNTSGITSPTLLNGLLMGFLGGYAFISEYTTAVPAALILGAAFLKSGNLKHRIGIAAGLVIPIIILALYNNAAFDHLLRIGYQYEVNQWFRTEMGKGLGGVGIPRPGTALELLFGPQKGLFWGQPLILLAFPGFYMMWKNGTVSRNIAGLCILVAVSAVLINSGYYEPGGGFAPGPRFLVWSIPFWFIGAAAGLSLTGTLEKAIAVGAAVFSIAYYVVITCVEPHIPHVFNAPLFQFTIPLVRGGWEFSNLATMAGVGGLWSLAPISVIVLVPIAIIAYKMFAGEDFMESAGGFVAGFLGVTVAFMISSFLAEPDPVQAAYYTGTALNGNGRYNSAEGYLSYSTTLNPNFPEAHYALGIAQMRLGKYNGAIESFKEYVELQPGHLQGHISLAAALATAGRYGEAEKQIDSSLLIFPGDNILTGLRNAVKRHTAMENPDE